MQALIFAAGRGKRMMPLTAATPKPLLKYKGHPLIERALSSLPAQIDEIIIVVGYLGEQIRAHIGASFGGRPVQYVEQRILNGTGGALLQCRQLLRGKFLVLYADDMFDTADLEKMVALDRAMLVSERDVAEVKGRVRAVETDPSGRFFQGLRESRPNEGETRALIFTGACVLDRHIFEMEFVPVPSAPDELSLPDTMVELAKTKQISIVRAKSWISISAPEDLK